MTIYVGNLSFKTTEAELKREFESFGDVSSTKIIMDPNTGQSRGFGFVEMPNHGEAEAAIAGTNGKELSGRELKVSEAKEREPHRGSARSGGGHGGGGYGRSRAGSSAGSGNRRFF